MTITTLNFQQQLLLMEALDEMAQPVRDRVAGGDAAMQDTLSQIEGIQHLVGTASSIQVETPRAVA